MNNTSLTTTAKVVLLMMRNDALEEANRKPMPKAAGAPSMTAASLVKLLQRRPMTTVNSAKITDDRTKAIPHFNARSGWRAGNPTMNGGAEKPLASTSIKAEMWTN